MFTRYWALYKNWICIISFNYRQQLCKIGVTIVTFIFSGEETEALERFLKSNGDISSLCVSVVYPSAPHSLELNKDLLTGWKEELVFILVLGLTPQTDFQNQSWKQTQPYIGNKAIPLDHFRREMEEESVKQQECLGGRHCQLHK